MSTDRQMDKEDIYTMVCYSAIKKNETLPFATTWMDLEAIMLSEISQRKTNNPIFKWAKDMNRYFSRKRYTNGQ